MPSIYQPWCRSDPYDARMANLAKALRSPRYRKPRPWRSKEESRMIRRFAILWFVVNMSQISARREAKSHAAQDHWISEQVFNWSGVPTTHLRPTLFAEWALYWTDLIKTGTLRLPFGTGNMRRSRRRIRLG